MVEAALYGPGGFYTVGGGAGRQRDFLTSPEVGPLFGAVVARAIDAAWERWGRPDPWVVVEAGAGTGTLAGAVLAARPACSAALRYVAVEVSPALRAVAASRLPLEDSAQLFGPRIPAGADPDGAARPAPGMGPLVAVMAELPAGSFDGVVLANELLDNLPFDVYRRTEQGWQEVRVGAAAGEGSAVEAAVGLAEVEVPAAAGLVEVEVPADEEVAAHLERLAPAGDIVPWQAAAGGWLRRALELLEHGQVIVLDYGRSTTELGQPPSRHWLRTYRRGGRGRPPLEALGTQDITADVALDQLALVRPPTRVQTQAAWLDRHGLDTLEDQARQAWEDGAAAGDLDALRARGRVAEAAELRDPDGLGGFTVIEWDAGGQE